MNPSLYSAYRRGMEEVNFQEKTWLREPLVIYMYEYASIASLYKKYSILTEHGNICCVTCSYSISPAAPISPIKYEYIHLN